jgi:glycosyltransferase involved in cell wall biosynthesis
MSFNACSIVVPIWNEEGNITPLIKRIAATMKSAKLTYEIIFIDDRSIDRSASLIKKASKKYPVTYCLKKGAQGKAQSLLEGFEHCRYNSVCMIDADLQYPPEAIAPMIQLLGNETDIVVANRTMSQVTITRKIVGASCRYLTGTLLHGLSCDIQSGLKVFKKDVIRSICISDASGWSFDLEFLLRAQDNGFKIADYDIIFDKRHSGETKVNLLEGSLSIGINAVKMKFRKQLKVHRLLQSA